PLPSALLLAPTSSRRSNKKSSVLSKSSSANAKPVPPPRPKSPPFANNSPTFKATHAPSNPSSPPSTKNATRSASASKRCSSKWTNSSNPTQRRHDGPDSRSPASSPSGATPEPGRLRRHLRSDLQSPRHRSSLHRAPRRHR